MISERVGEGLAHSDATHWAVHSAVAAVVDIFTVTSGSGIHTSDDYFV